MSVYLLTGASRGIGLELTDQLLDLPPGQVNKVVVVVRSVSDPLRRLVEAFPERIKTFEVEDVTVDRIAAVVPKIDAALNGDGVDVLINVVGSNQPFTSGGLKTLDSADLSTALNTNVLTTHAMISQTLPLLEKGKEKKIINISTSLGSIALARQTSFAPVHAYKIAKAALNMLTVQYAVDLEEQGFTVLAISPGWLKTDLGGKDMAHLDVPAGVTALKDIILSADQKVNGKFLDIKVQGWEGTYDGGEIPW